MRLFDLFKKKNARSQQTSYQTMPEKQNASMVIVSDIDKINTILNQEIKDFFPEDGHWWSSCYSKSNQINYSNLPCHLRDNKWMSKLLHKKLIDKGIYINECAIERYMNSSDDFIKHRHSYELRIVTWQINWMRKGGEGWLIPNEYDELSLLLGPDVDKIFRAGVVKTLLAIGMDKDIIEEGIEKNAGVWRTSCMSQSFEHIYMPVAYLKGFPNPPEPTHKQNWIKMRLYEYYIEHKESVDRYSHPTKEMLMDESEVHKLSEILNRQNLDRQAYLEEWKKTTKPKSFNNNLENTASR